MKLKDGGSVRAADLRNCPHVVLRLADANAARYDLDALFALEFSSGVRRNHPTVRALEPIIMTPKDANHPDRDPRRPQVREEAA